MEQAQLKQKKKKTWSARNSKTVYNYLIANSKLLELFLDVRVYRVSDNGSDHFLTLAKLRFPSKWLHLPQNTARKKIHFIIKLHYSMIKKYKTAIQTKN
jgi:hypothetical protein